MGFGDKLKGLKDQAQQAVAENKEKIQGAVQVVGEAANTKTHGKYADKIAKVGEKVESSVEKFTQGEESAGTPGTAGTAGAAAGAAAAGAAAAATSTGAASEGAIAPAAAGAPTFSEPDDTDASAAPIVHEPTDPVTPSAADEAASGFPEFE